MENSRKKRINALLSFPRHIIFLFFSILFFSSLLFPSLHICFLLFFYLFLTFLFFSSFLFSFLFFSYFWLIPSTTLFSLIFINHLGLRSPTPRAPSLFSPQLYTYPEKDSTNVCIGLQAIEQILENKKMIKK